jgi:hypothetical protein
LKIESKNKDYGGTKSRFNPVKKERDNSHEANAGMLKTQKKFSISPRGAKDTLYKKTGANF